MMQDLVATPKVVDVEWNFGVTAASSEMKVVGKTYLHVKMVYQGDGGDKELQFEMTLPQFYAFLHDLERAKSSMNYLS